MKDVKVPPVIVYTGKDITREEEYELRKYAKSIIIKGVKSEERLLDEAALFLHQVVDKLPEEKKKVSKEPIYHLMKDQWKYTPATTIWQTTSFPVTLRTETFL